MKKIILGMGLLFSLIGCTKEISSITDRTKLDTSMSLVGATVTPVFNTDTTPAFTSLIAAMRLKVSKVAILLIGDSTGNEESEWFYLFIKWILTQFPDYVVEYHLWSASADNYSSTVKLVYGANATATSPRLIVYNGSIPGAGVAYLSDTNRIKKIVVSGVDYKSILISCSHNDRVQDTGTTYINTYKTFMSRIRKITATGQLIITTQNPENPPVAASKINSHKIRRPKILQFAWDNKIKTVDANKAFYSQGVDISTLLKDDGLHPNASGSQVWADEEIRIFKQALQ